MKHPSPLTNGSDTILLQIAAVVGSDIAWKRDAHVSGDKFETARWQLWNKSGYLVATFSLVPMPGCCGVCISTGAYVYSPYTKKGLGTLLNRLRVQMARQAGYGVLFCTDMADNVPQTKILARNGWHTVHAFHNPRTGNKVNLSVINL